MGGKVWAEKAAQGRYVGISPENSDAIYVYDGYCHHSVIGNYRIQQYNGLTLTTKGSTRMPDWQTEEEAALPSTHELDGLTAHAAQQLDLPDAPPDESDVPVPAGAQAQPISLARC